MKVLAPFSRADEVPGLIAAGADELYCGVTPPGWAQAFGASWVHRRNPRTSLGGVEELAHSVSLSGGRPVFVTLNAPSYPAGAVSLLVGFARVLVRDVGVAALIVGDWELLLALHDDGLAGHVHVSSLASCRNRRAAAFYRDLGVARIILPRHVSLGEIESIAEVGVPLEAFALNDGCAFEEGTCSTTHAYGAFCVDDRLEGKLAPLSERYEFWKWTLDNCGCQTSRGYTLGPCGLCAVPRMLRAGVASLKVVGREASSARKAASVRLAARARDLAVGDACPADIRAAVIAERGAPELCAGAHLCYYPDVWGPDCEAAAANRPRRIIPLRSVEPAMATPRDETTGVAAIEPSRSVPCCGR